MPDSTLTLLRRSDVQKLTGFSCSTIYRLMRSNPPQFPEPIRIGERAVRWRRSDLDEWLAARPLATGEASATIKAGAACTS